MTWGAVAVGGATLVSGYFGNKSASKSADKAANAQILAAKEGAQAQLEGVKIGTAEQRRQFDAIQKLLMPYINAGNQSLEQQQSLLGIGGPQAAQAAINAIKSGPEYTSLLKAGNDTILQNAAATGGLRGGNTEAALAQFSPGLLADLIQRRFQNLSGMTSIGQNAAAGVGNAGMQTGTNIANLALEGGKAAAAGFSEAGAATAGNYLAQGQNTANMWNLLPQTLGAYYGYKGKF